ncbi:hypothetical protein GY45DRAFT_1331625 [Cubamyces sp. BRFM 1775]|nr:hypothetical protein GY45DRAFT_1331625 [Cubamyces sp. BRFM 1775]
MAGVIASSPSPVMSSSALPRTPSPAPRQEADVNAGGASAIALGSETVAQAVQPDFSFFKNHLRPCPEKVVSAIQNLKSAKTWVDQIMLVKTAEHDLYEPASRLLSLISEKIFKYLKGKGHSAMPAKEIVFLDHHRYSLTHFPTERLEDKPDIVGVFQRYEGFEQDQSGSYKNIPYHRVETVVEAKAIYGGGEAGGRAQATRYAFKLQQARPDRPGVYVLSIKPQHFQVVFSSPVGVTASEHALWTNLPALCSYVYSLYDPPDGHFLYDPTITWREPTPLGAPVWDIVTTNRRFTGAKLIFVGDPWARRTTVFRVEKKGSPTLMLKESYLDCGRRFQEYELLEQVHEEGYLPGVLCPLGHEFVVADGREIVFHGPQSMTRKKHRIWCADVGFELTLAESVNDLLKAVYDALEVHRTMACERRILHRDMSFFNVFMYPQLGPRDRPCMDNCPPLIDDVMEGMRELEERKARCLIIDLDNAAKLLGEPADAIKIAELRNRTGTPAYIARAVSGGMLWCHRSSLDYEYTMPLLKGDAETRYINAYGEERYNRYNDLNGTIHGGKRPQFKTKDDLIDIALGQPFYHRWEYDAESIFWTMYSALLRVVPQGFQETLTSEKSLEKDWEKFRLHTIPDELNNCEDSRTYLIDRNLFVFKRAFPDVMEPVAKLLLQIVSHVRPSYALMDDLPIYEDHLHEAMQRLILQYLFNNADNPIPLTPYKLRQLVTKDTAAVNRGKLTGSKQEFAISRGSKRSAPDAPVETRYSKRLAGENP